MINPQELAFIKESNLIERITREPTEAEIEEFLRFKAQDEITLKDMIQFVSVYQPDAELRDRRGMNVMIANYHPPAGDVTVKTRLMHILDTANKFKGNRVMAHDLHISYEQLHPFMDGNGRSGRMLWYWMMKDQWIAPMGFLQTWYYQTLSNSRVKDAW